MKIIFNIIKLLIAVSLFIALLSLLVSNRQLVIFNNAYPFEDIYRLPLFLIIIISLFAGAVIGYIVRLGSGFKRVTKKAGEAKPSNYAEDVKDRDEIIRSLQAQIKLHEQNQNSKYEIADFNSSEGKDG